MGTRDGAPCASNPDSLGPFALLLNAATVSPAAQRVPYSQSSVSYERTSHNNDGDSQCFTGTMRQAGRQAVQRLPPVAHLAEGPLPTRSPPPEQQCYSEYSACVQNAATYHQLPGMQSTLPPIQYAVPPAECSSLAMLSAAAEHRSEAHRHRASYGHPGPYYPHVYPSHPVRAYVHPSSPAQTHQHYHVHPARMVIPPVSVSPHSGVQSYTETDVRSVPQFAQVDEQAPHPTYEPFRGSESSRNGNAHFTFNGRSPAVSSRSTQSFPKNRKLPSPSQILSHPSPSVPTAVAMKSVSENIKESPKAEQDFSGTRTVEVIGDRVKLEEAEQVMKEHPKDASKKETTADSPPESPQASVAAEKKETEDDRLAEKKKKKLPDIAGQAVETKEVMQEEAEEETRCPCRSAVNEGFMIACDDCDTWQHGKCMGYRRRGDAPEKYYCHLCRPGAVRKGSRAYSFVAKKREVHDKFLKDIRIPELRRKLAHALVQRESRKWSTKDAWISHMFQAFAGLLKTHFKGDRQAVVSGLALVLKMKRSDVDGKLKYASKKLRRSAPKVQKHGSSHASASAAEGSASKRFPDGSKRAAREGVSGPDGRDLKAKRKALERQARLRSDNDSAREDDFDVVSESVSYESEETKPVANSTEPLSREERKIQQIMKQFERLEQQEQKRKGGSHGTPKNRNHDTVHPNGALSGRVGKNTKKEKGGKKGENKGIKEVEQRKRSTENLEWGEANESTEHSLGYAEKKIHKEFNQQGDQAGSEIADRKNAVIPKESMGNQPLQDSTQVSDMHLEGQSDLTEELQKGTNLMHPPGRRTQFESMTSHKTKPIIHYNRGSSEERDSDEEAESVFAIVTSNHGSADEGQTEQESESNRRPFKRPRLSLCIPSPGPSVLGSPLIPEALRSPLVDAGRPRKRPRMLDRKARLLKTASSQDLPTKKKLLLSALSPTRETDDLPISPSSLPSCFVSNGQEHLGVGMVVVNVDKEVGDESGYNQAGLYGEYVQTPLPNSARIHSPQHPWKERTEDLSTSTCSTTEKEESDNAPVSLERKSSCLKKRPRLRLELSDAYDSPSPSPIEHASTPVKSPCTSTLMSPRPPLLRGLRSVPAPTAGRSTPPLRSAPCKPPPLISTPAPVVSSPSPLAQALVGDINSDLHPEKVADKSAPSSSCQSLLPKKTRLLSPDVSRFDRSWNHGDLFNAKVSPDFQVTDGGKDDLKKSKGLLSAPSEEVPDKHRLSASEAKPKPEDEHTKSTVGSSIKPVDSKVMVSTDDDDTSQEGAHCGPQLKEDSSLSKAVTSANTRTTRDATGDDAESASPSNILHVRLRGFLSRAADEKPQTEVRSSEEKKVSATTAVPQQGEKITPVSPDFKKAHRRGDGPRSGPHGKRNGFRYFRPFAFNSHGQVAHHWTGGYRASFKGKQVGNSLGGMQSGLSNRYGQGFGEGKRGRSNVSASHHGYRSANGGRSWRNGRRFGSSVSGLGTAGHLQGSAAWRNFRENKGWAAPTRDRKLSPNGDSREAQDTRP